MKYLSKGQQLVLPSSTAAKIKFGIGLGWDHAPGNQNLFDLDMSAMMLAGQYMPDPSYFVYYQNMASPDGAVRHSGDNRSGAGSGDDETLTLELGKLDPAITEIRLMVSIHEGLLKNQHFGLLPHAYIRLYDWDTQEELLRYNLRDELRYFDTGEFGRLARQGKDWAFMAMGKGEHGGLHALLATFKKPGD
jgi:tellurium resistance protein TerD